MKRLIRFSLPFLGSAIIQQLYSTTDMIFAGWFLGSNGAAAIGSTSIIATIIIGVFTGLGVGISTHIAGLFGKKDTDQIKVAVESAVTLTFILAIPVIGGLEFFANQILYLMHTPAEIYSDSLLYLRIYSVSAAAIIFYNILTGIVRSLGDSLSPMWAQLFGGLLNVFSNYLFIVKLEKGILGAAIATLLSQAVAAFVTFLFLMKRLKEKNIACNRFRISLTDDREILKVGIPTAIQACIITFSNLCVQSQVNTLGVIPIAAFATYFKVENFIYYPIMAIGQANAILTAQDYGSGNVKKMFSGMHQAMALGFFVSVLLAVILIVFRIPVFGLFGNDQEVISLGAKMMVLSFPFYFLYLIMEVLSGTIRSTKDAFLPMVAVVMNMCPLRLFVLFLLMKNNILPPGLVLLFPITWFTTVISLSFIYIYWKKMRFGTFAYGTKYIN